MNATLYARFNEAGSNFENRGKSCCQTMVGLGPAGELRYPSYQENQGWVFPGIGDFQVRPISYVL